MTPKEKAEDLFYKYLKVDGTDFNIKQSALIAVDEIIGQWEVIDVYLADGNGQLNQNLKYWYTVKKEIDKL
jgi:hypothetical protein